MSTVTITDPPHHRRGHYNKIYNHEWSTGVTSLPEIWIKQINDCTTHNWGWHFVSADDQTKIETVTWHEDYKLFLTFESPDDLVQVKLSLKH